MPKCLLQKNWYFSARMVNGRLVGAYLRNQTILHGREVKDAMKRWGTCELASMHTSCKKTVKFDVVHCKKNSALCNNEVFDVSPFTE